MLAFGLHQLRSTKGRSGLVFSACIRKNSTKAPNGQNPRPKAAIQQNQKRNAPTTIVTGVASPNRGPQMAPGVVNPTKTEQVLRLWQVPPTGAQMGANQFQGLNTLRPPYALGQAGPVLNQSFEFQQGATTSPLQPPLSPGHPLPRAMAGRPPGSMTHAYMNLASIRAEMEKNRKLQAARRATVEQMRAAEREKRQLRRGGNTTSGPNQANNTFEPASSSGSAPVSLQRSKVGMFDTPTGTPSDPTAAAALSAGRVKRATTKTPAALAFQSRRKLTASQKLGRGRAAARAGRLVVISEHMTPKELAKQMGLQVARVMEKLEEAGEKIGLNDHLDPDIAELISVEFGMRIVRADARLRDRRRTVPPTAEALSAINAPHRAPIITVMGHVDHGKTSLLDALRGSNITGREAGGITQGVSAFSVVMSAETKGILERKRAEAEEARRQQELEEKELMEADEAQLQAALDAPSARRKTRRKRGSSATAAEQDSVGDLDQSSSSRTTFANSNVDVMTFLDTPGHALFSSMRKRGGSVTDIVVLVVDGKDGMKPQTIECVEIILKSNVTCVVAVTKCDTIDPEVAVTKVAAQLLEHGLMTEPYGGEVPLVPVSSRTGFGLEQLKETIALHAEMLDLRAVQDAQGEAIVLDSRVVQGQGQVVDAIVTWGTLRVGDVFVAGGESGRVKALFTDATGAASLSRRLKGHSSGDADGMNGDKKQSKKDKKKDKKDKKGNKQAQVGPAGLMTSNTVDVSENSFALAQVQEAVPGTPVRILGVSGAPEPGMEVLVVENEERAKSVLDGRQRKAKAEASLRVLSADALVREAEREEYKRRRMRKVAFDLATKRERQRQRLRRAGTPIPDYLVAEPWEEAILQEAHQGKIVGVTSTGRKQRLQGGQQSDLTFGYAAADSLSEAVASGELTAEGAAEMAANRDAPLAPKSVSFLARADSMGGLTALSEAVRQAIEQSKEVQPRLVGTPSVGDITEKDVIYAEETGAHILAFGVRVPSAVQKLAEKKKVTIISSKVIYHLLDELCELLGSYLPVEWEEEIVGVAEVKAVFSLNVSKKTDPSTVAGCVIVDGTFAKSAQKFRIIREGEQLHEDTSLSSLQHMKERVESVKKGSECGMSLPGFNEYTVGDKIQAIRLKPKKRKVALNF